MSHIAPAAEPRCAPQTLVRQTPVRLPGPVIAAT